MPRCRSFDLWFLVVFFLLSNVKETWKQVSKKLGNFTFQWVATLGLIWSETHVYTCLRRVVPSNSLHHTIWTDLAITLSQIPIWIQNVLPVCSLPKGPGAIIISVITYVGPISYTELQNISVHAQFCKSCKAGDASSLATAFVFYFQRHDYTHITFAPG